MPAARCACSTSRSVEWWHAICTVHLHETKREHDLPFSPVPEGPNRMPHNPQPHRGPWLTFYRMGSLLSFSTPTSSRSTRKRGPSGSSARPAAVSCHRSTEPGVYYTVTSTLVCCHHEAQPTKPCCNNYALVEVPGERFVVNVVKQKSLINSWERQRKQAYLPIRSE